MYEKEGKEERGRKEREIVYQIFTLRVKSM